MSGWQGGREGWLRGVIISIILLGGALSPPRAAAANAPITPAEEARIGQEIAAEVEAHYGRLEDPALLRRVTTVGKRLASAAGFAPGSFTFRLLNSPDFNALALPGNIIYVTRGLVEGVGADDELAAAMGHEVAHIVLGHARAILDAKPIRRRVLFVVEIPMPDGTIIRREAVSEGPPMMPGIRAMELDADCEALVLMRQAGYRPEATVTMLERLRRPEDQPASAESGEMNPEVNDFLSTHPSPAERIRRVKEQLRALQHSATVVSQA